MKVYAVTIGYQTYAVEARDIGKLLAIAARSREIRQTGYTGPYRPIANSELLVTAVVAVDFEEEYPAEPDAPIEAAPGSPDPLDEQPF